MREICKSGSEGGASQFNETSLPLSLFRRFATGDVFRFYAFDFVVEPPFFSGQGR